MATATEEPKVESPKQSLAPTRLVSRDEGPLAYLFDTARFEQVQRIASAMASASLIPDHLRGKCPQIKDEKLRYDAEHRQTIGNCLLVVNQAVRWGADPFAVAAETYVVHGKLGYQGKLVAAIVNTRAGLKDRLTQTYSGSGDGRTVAIRGTFEDETDPREITLSVGQAKTDNQMWKNDPDQKLWYSGVIKWARRHCPEVLLGILTDDDLDRARIDSSYALPEGHAIEQPPSRAAIVAAEIRAQTAVNGAHEEKSDGVIDEGRPTEESSAAAKQSVEEKIKPAAKSEQHGVDPFFARLSVRTQKKLEAEGINSRQQLADMSQQTMLESFGSAATDEIKTALNGKDKADEAEANNSAESKPAQEKKPVAPTSDKDPLRPYLETLAEFTELKDCDKLLSNAKLTRAISKKDIDRLEIAVADRKAEIEAKGK